MLSPCRPDRQADPATPEKRWIGHSFSRAASGYDQVAALQRQAGDGLLARLRRMPLAPRTILDVGAGTGYCTALLARAFPDAQLIALDIAEGMLRVLGGKGELRQKALRICGDGESLPLRGNTVDLVFSNLAMQWFVDLPAVMAGYKRVLRPKGAVLFSTFGEASLCELRKAWSEADGYSHVNDFVPSASVRAALIHAGFRDVHVDAERQILSYPSVDEVLRELKRLGAHNVTANRPRHLTGKGVFRKMKDAYTASMPQGRIKATFEIVYGQALF